MTIVITFGFEIHILVAAFVSESEVLVDLLDQAHVERGPLIAVAIGITAFTALRQDRRGDRPVFAERGGAIAGEAPGVGSRP